MSLTSELVGRAGAYSLLNRVFESANIVRAPEIEEFLQQEQIPQDLFSDLTKEGFFIGAPTGFYISSLGKKVTLLLRALNDKEEISEVFRKLSSIYPRLRPYELITERVTDYFIDGLYATPDFIRLSICSPWIRLDENHIKKLQNATSHAVGRYGSIQIRVITVPLDQYHNKKSAIESLKALKDLGALIVTNTKLHAKLYMSEPGPLGGAHYAILGSENLTGKGNIELAIRIENDNEMLAKLEQYYFDILQNSQLLQGV